MTRVPRLCSIDGCNKKHSSRGWCATHYNNWKRRGDPLSVGKPGQPRKHEYPEGATSEEIARIRARINQKRRLSEETSEEYEARLQRQRDYYASHINERRSYGRDRWASNSKRLRAKNKEYYESHPEKWDEYRRRRKALKRGGEPYTTKQALDLYGTVCHLCLEDIDMDAPRQTGQPGWERGLHLDHVIPLSQGGPDILSNIRPSHGLCNLQKWKNL